MLLKLLLLLVVLAPVPAPPRPDPLGTGYLGVRPVDLDPSGSDLTLGTVMDGEPAYRAGLRVGDTLVKVGPHAPRRFDDVREYVYGLRPGTRIPVEIRRGDRTLTFSVVVGDRPASLPPLDPLGPNGQRRIPVIPPNR